MDESGYFTFTAGHDNAWGIGMLDKNLAAFHDYANKELANIDFGESWYEVNFERIAADSDIADILLGILGKLLHKSQRYTESDKISDRPEQTDRYAYDTEHKKLQKIFFEVFQMFEENKNKDKRNRRSHHPDRQLCKHSQAYAKRDRYDIFECAVFVPFQCIEHCAEKQCNGKNIVIDTSRHNNKGWVERCDSKRKNQSPAVKIKLTENFV